jgi:hypothetical protein
MEDTGNLTDARPSMRLGVQPAGTRGRVWGRRRLLGRYGVAQAQVDAGSRAVRGGRRKLGAIPSECRPETATGFEPLQITAQTEV